MSGSFGEKMLKKMGWEQGRGLGVQGQGGTRPLHLETQKSTKGVRFLSLFYLT